MKKEVKKKIMGLVQEMYIMLRERSKEIKAIIDEWLRNNGEKDFITKEFCDENKFNKDERNIVTSHFRGMNRKWDSKKRKIEILLKDIENNEKSELPEKAKIKVNLEKKFLNEADCSYGDWIKMSEDDRFKYLKDLMKKSGIYVRINTKDKQRYIEPVLQQRIEKSWDIIFPRINTAANAIENNLSFIMGDDITKKTYAEIVNCVKTLQKMSSRTKYIDDSVHHVLGKYTDWMVYLGESIIMKQIGEGEIMRPN